MFRSFAAFAVIAATTSIAGASLAQTADQPIYLDDRSTPVQLALSYFNAIDRGELVRAHGYFGAEDAPDYDGWQSDLQDIVEAEVSLGQMAQEGAAGSTYYQLPVTVDYRHAEGGRHTERGCVAIRWVTPASQTRPPFQPMHIVTADLHGEAEEQGFAPANCTGTPDIGTGSPAFLDDRSTPEQLIRSYFNALERGEFGRAVLCFSPSSAPADYDAWWTSVEPARELGLTFGSPHHDSRAGWIAYSVPVAVTAEGHDGSTRLEVGCIGVYQELPNGEQPFVPMTMGPVQLERRVAGSAPALPNCDD